MCNNVMLDFTTIQKIWEHSYITKEGRVISTEERTRKFEKIPVSGKLCSSLFL